MSVFYLVVSGFWAGLGIVSIVLGRDDWLDLFTLSLICQVLANQGGCK